jgi:hypothetical protein
MHQSKYQTQSRNIEVDRKKPGMIIDGKYLLIEKIGTGSFGEVWRAKYLGLRGRSSEIVAIKFMHSACATAESRRDLVGKFTRYSSCVAILMSLR